MTAGTTYTKHDRDHYRSPQGMVEIVVGGAGCDEMPLRGGYTSVAGGRRGVPNPLTSTPVYATDKLATGILDIVNGSFARWRLFGSEDGAILDEVAVSK